jgi:hypothetical protein
MRDGNGGGHRFSFVIPGPSKALAANWVGCCRPSILLPNSGTPAFGGAPE